MRTCLVIAACLGFVLLAGCNRCGMWDWYEPCDLIEGRAARSCNPCDPCGYQAGQVVRREIAVPAPCAASATATPPAPVVVEPLPPPAVEPGGAPQPE